MCGMAAWRGPPSPHQTETSIMARVEDDAKQKPRSALGETQCEAGALSRMLSKLDVCSHFRRKKRLGTKLCPRGVDGVDGGGDGEAREKLLRRECRSESTTGVVVVEDGEGMYQWIVSLWRFFSCTSSSHSTSPSGESILGHADTKSDQQRREEARIIRLKRKDHLSDPTNLDTTVFGSPDQSARVLDTPVEMPSEAVAEEIILDLGGGEVLGGLSFQGYEHVVFSTCPASLVDSDVEG